ncbi:glycerol-3-phosphate dehydrogenase/oxidase [Neobacillus sp. D3-1R]|uniref:glycerol-3-phosphate dehydrogenase/oxidase n=1 Tax=Neobacillus sp. D3-1R TaxID=3445778 RepID=UPI003FA07518
MNFSYFSRKEIISRLKETDLDVLVIGGGITGAGITLDAASRGMKVGLVEMQDFSAGTSSRSTKLVHGGLRYLKQFEVKMVAEVGKERTIVYENGPHVTKPEWMLLPIHKGGTFGMFSTSAGLRIYDFLAGVKKKERRKMLSPEETIQKEPLIKRNGLKGAGYYVEYRTDDARLTIEVTKAAFTHGALTVNYTKVQSLKYENGKVRGAFVKDKLSDELFEIRAKYVVNAAGPWVDSIREFDQSKQGKFLRLSKGVHIVVDQTLFPLKQAVYFDTPDGRMVFAIPRSTKTYIGTTDTFYDDDPISPATQLSDCTYILNAIQYMFPNIHITEKDVESSWAGVRPLIFEEGKKPSEISRKDEIWESKSGLLTIAGGKLTGYRKMAETVVDLLADKFKKQSGLTFKLCSTKDLPISGGDFGGSVNLDEFIKKQALLGKNFGLTEEEGRELAEIYGSNSSSVFKLIPEADILSKEYNIARLVVLKLLYAIHFEMIVNPNDFFFRRTGELLFDTVSVRKNKMAVMDIMTNYLQWDRHTRSNYLEELERTLQAVQYPFT